jgi:predicted PhzF superfamily epimerase YddE/YHI9
MATNNVDQPGQEPGILPAPEYAPVRENEQVLLSLGITADHIAALPMIVHSGAAFLLLEVRTREILQSLQPALEIIRQLSGQYGLSGYCIFYRHTGNQADAVVRIILTAVPNGPAVGHSASAAGALACYLYDIAMIKKDEMVIIHAHSPESPSSGRMAVHLHIQEGKIFSLQTGIIEPAR